MKRIMGILSLLFMLGTMAFFLVPEWFEPPAPNECKSAKACLTWGTHYQNNPDKAFKYNTNACLLGSKLGCQRVAAYRKNHKAEAAQDQSCDSGDAQSCLERGDRYLKDHHYRHAAASYERAYDLDKDNHGNTRALFARDAGMRHRLEGIWMGRYAHWIFLVMALAAFARHARRKITRHMQTPAANTSAAPHYHPPEGFSMMRSALLYDIQLEVPMLDAALIELVDLGHIRIDREKLVVRHTHKSISNRLSKDQQFLLRKLFTNGYPLERSKHQKRPPMERIKTMLYDWGEKEGYVKRNTLLDQYAGWMLGWMLFASVLFGYALYEPGSSFGEIVDHIFRGIVLGIGTFFGYFMVWTAVQLALGSFSDRRHSRWHKHHIITAVTLPVILLPAFYSAAQGLIYAEWMIVAAILITLLFWMDAQPYRYTPKGEATHLQIAGLREFIARVHLDAMRREYREDMYYTDRLMPYAVYFDLMESWIGIYRSGE